jgi:hypothetical protein
VTPHLFPFEGGVRGVICLFFLVPNVFLTCPQHVPLRFLMFSSCSFKAFQIAPEFYPMWFAQCLNLMYIN